MSNVAIIQLSEDVLDGLKLINKYPHHSYSEVILERISFFNYLFKNTLNLGQVYWQTPSERYLNHKCSNI
jgi:hypothetical protein